MINIFLLGQKGLEAISGIEKTLLNSINALVIGRDSGVVNDYSEAIETFAKTNNIRYFFRNAIDAEALAKAGLNIAIGWRWLISADIPLIVFHDSILPKYRGFNPLVSALINGDAEIGVSALFGTEEFDRGDIIAQRKISVAYPIKIETAIETLSKEYAALMQEITSDFGKNSLKAEPQIEAEASYSLWRDDEDYKIDWNQDSDTIKRMIDAVGFPYKGAFSEADGVQLRIFDAQVVPDVAIVNRTPGKVLFKNADGFVIVCGQGLLKINRFFNNEGQPIELSKFRIRFK